ncbi:hypothetical protein KDA_47760 [Dictyobacter alpinus]|uniref:Uncharacterized protein n=1 Tax=Dictyobacter alpinus TaxID=2014873 RepID=A0A402BDC9_9CHLR|nr:hypothetical protein KDA_47760 [Dictyobacter alpinus]
MFWPATGELRAKAVDQSTNAILHPWLKQELEKILQRCPPARECQLETLTMVVCSTVKKPDRHIFLNRLEGDEEIEPERDTIF